MLFNIFFINDISHLGLKNVLFADDAGFSAESEHFHELVEIFQRFVSILSDWLNTNKLVTHESTSQIHPNLNSLEWMSHIKYLGIILDNKLLFK